MSFFGGLKKVFNPGGAVVSKVIGDGHDYQGILDYAMKGKKNAQNGAVPPTPFDPGQRTGSSINGQSGVPQPAMRLGWTNGGYNYANSPFNGQSPTPANPMSMAPPQTGIAPPQPPLQGPQNPGSMPPAGAQPPNQGPPTMHIPTDPQMVQAMMLRGRQM